MAVVLMGTWTGHFLGGFSWQSDPQHQFNWHPLLMTIGLVFLYGNGETGLFFRSKTVTIFEIFSPKNLSKKLAFLPKKCTVEVLSLQKPYLVALCPLYVCIDLARWQQKTVLSQHFL
jgi:hypothetical protein